MFFWGSLSTLQMVFLPGFLVMSLFYKENEMDPIPGLFL